MVFQDICSQQPQPSLLLRYPFTHPTNPSSSSFSLENCWMLFIHFFVYRLIDCDRLLSAAQLNEFPLRQAHTHSLLYATFAPLRLKGFLGHVSGSHHRSSLSCSSMTCSLLIGFTPPLPLALVSLSMFPLCLDCSEKNVDLKKKDEKNKRRKINILHSFKCILVFKGRKEMKELGFLGGYLGCKKPF